MGTLAVSIQRIYLFLSMVIHRITGFFTFDTRLHKARLARIDELGQLLSPTPEGNALLLGVRAFRKSGRDKKDRATLL